MTATNKAIAICYFIIAIRVCVGCDTDCTVCADRDACIASVLECAYSPSGGCIPFEETPFIYIVEAAMGYNWYEAEVRCETLHNSHLASVRSQQEHEWAESYCESKGRAACWTGGYFYYNDGPDEFMWLDGADFTYGASAYPNPPWNSNKPTFNGCDDSHEVCVLKVGGTSGDGWTDLPNENSPIDQTEAAFCRRDCICPDDGNPCTDEICVEGECVHNPVADITSCSTTCVPNGKCFEGTCIGEIECGSAECDGLCCNDENPCMENTVCSESTCTGTPVTDGETCTIGCIVGLCTNGQCLDGEVDCSLGCDGTPCDDGNDLTIDDICSENVCVGNPIPTPNPTANPIPSPTAMSANPTAITANPTLDPTESSDSSSEESSDSSSEEVDGDYAMAVQDNNQLLDPNVDGYDNTYNVIVELNDETRTCLWIILATFVVCNGVFIWYWYRTNATQKKSSSIL